MPPHLGALAPEIGLCLSIGPTRSELTRLLEDIERLRNNPDPVLTPSSDWLEDRGASVHLSQTKPPSPQIVWFGLCPHGTSSRMCVFHARNTSSPLEDTMWVAVRRNIRQVRMGVFRLSGEAL